MSRNPVVGGTSRKGLAVAAVAALALSVPALAPTASAVAARGATSAVMPCGTMSDPPAHFAHIIWIWMENQSYNSIIGSPNAPYINGLVGQCGLATNYHNITHPSAPEYLAATSGYIGGVNDCSPSQCPDSHPSFFAQISSAGETWKGYDEFMTTNCENAFTNLYDVNHNPAVYYPALHAQCLQDDIPMGTPKQGNFEHDLATGLPSFSFVTPNLIHDSHNSNVATGDAYLARLVPTILNSAVYATGSVALFIVWDEGEGGSSNNCAYNTTDVGCHVAAVVVSPYTVPGTQSAVLFNHYGLLKTAEQLLGLPSYLGHANDSKVSSMVSAFNL